MRKPLFLLLTALVAVAAPAQQTLTTPALPAEIPPAPTASEDVLSLGLTDAYSLALARNLDLQIGRFNVARADTGILRASAVFDPNLAASIFGDGSSSPAATQLAGADVTESRSTSFSVGVNQLLPSGTQLSVDASAVRAETNSQFFFLNPRWTTNLDLALTQPLLDGFGTTVNRAGLVIAKLSRQESSAVFAETVIGTLQQVENAYWDMVAAREAVGVQESSLDLADQLLSETNERVRVGTSAPIDIVQSEASVAVRKQELIAARNQAADAEDALKKLLGFDAPEEWETDLVATEPLEVEPIHPDLQTSITRAFERRPEVHQQLLTLETIKRNLAVARNRALPSLDLEARYGWGGIGGDLLLTDPDTGEVLGKISGGLSDAADQLANRDFPTWRIGVNLSLPIGNNQAQADVAERRWQLEQQLTSLRALKQQVILEVRQAVRSLEDGLATIDATEASARLAERNLEAERTKFANGLSTNFQVSQIQDDLAQARLDVVRAWLSYHRALVAYQVAVGGLLEAHDIRIADPGIKADIPHDFWKDVEWLQFVDLKDLFGSDDDAVGQPATSVDAAIPDEG